MFRFSKWLDTRKALDGWEKWFKTRGIATEIKQKRLFFALYLNGIEAISESQAIERRSHEKEIFS